MFISYTWRDANGLVRSDLAAPDSGVNVSILVTLFQATFQNQNAYSVSVGCESQLRAMMVFDPNLTR